MAMKYLKLFEEWKSWENFQLNEADAGYSFDPTKPSDFPVLQTVCGDFEKLDNKKRENLIISLLKRSYQKEGEVFDKNAGSDLFNDNTVNVTKKVNIASITSVLKLQDVTKSSGKNGWKDEDGVGVYNKMIKVTKAQRETGDRKIYVTVHPTYPHFYELICGKKSFSYYSKEYKDIVLKEEDRQVPERDSKGFFTCNLLDSSKYSADQLTKAGDSNLYETLYQISQGNSQLKYDNKVIPVKPWEKKIAGQILQKLEERANELNELDSKNIVEATIEIPGKYLISFERDEKGDYSDDLNITEYPVVISVDKFSKPEAAEGEEESEASWVPDEDFQEASGSKLGMVLYFINSLANGSEETKYMSATGKNNYKGQMLAIFNKEAQTEAFAFKGNIEGKSFVAGTRSGITTFTDSDGTKYLGQINFDFNSSKLDSADIDFIKNLSSAYFDQAKKRVRVVGHSDGKGSDKANMDISKARAAAVVKVLESTPLGKELKKRKISIVPEGKGYNDPIFEDEKGSLIDYASVNRRVDIILDDNKPNYDKIREAIKNKFNKKK